MPSGGDRLSSALAYLAPALGELVALVARGVVKAPVGMVLPLSDAAVAHRHLEKRTSVGKIVLKPWP